MTSIPRAHPSQRKNSPDTPGRIITELDPQQVDNLTNAIITAFQGNQGSLLMLTTQASVLTQTLAGPDAALGDLIANLDRLMTTLAAQSANLETMLHETSVSIAALNGRRDELVSSVVAESSSMFLATSLME